MSFSQSLLVCKAAENQKISSKDLRVGNIKTYTQISSCRLLSRKFLEVHVYLFQTHLQCLTISLCKPKQTRSSNFIYLFFKNLFIYLFLAVLGLRFCARAFSRCGKRGPLFIAVRGPLTIAASLVAEHRLQTRRLSSCDSRAQLLRGMWDLPRPGLEPVSPALAGGLSTTAPPRKPEVAILKGEISKRHQFKHTHPTYTYTQTYTHTHVRAKKNQEWPPLQSGSFI